MRERERGWEGEGTDRNERAEEPRVMQQVRQRPVARLRSRAVHRHELQGLSGDIVVWDSLSQHNDACVCVCVYVCISYNAQTKTLTSERAQDYTLSRNTKFAYKQPTFKKHRATTKFNKFCSRTIIAYIHVIHCDDNAVKKSKRKNSIFFPGETMRP